LSHLLEAPRRACTPRRRLSVVRCCLLRHLPEQPVGPWKRGSRLRIPRRRVIRKPWQNTQTHTSKTEKHSHSPMNRIKSAWRAEISG
jgi:hypothetical protein